MPPLLFSTSSYEQFTESLAAAIGGEIGVIERRDFPDGEHYQRIETPLNRRDVVLVGGSVDDQDSLCLFDLGCAAVRGGARRLTLVIPYYGYSTMERAAKPGEVVTAKTRALLFSAIPPAAFGNRLFLLELHSEGIPHYFEGGLVATHLSATTALTPWLQEVGGERFILASADAGRAKRVEALANALGVEAAVLIKRRRSGSETEVIGVNAQVDGRRVIIYDDMIRTGGSILRAAEVYREAGAREVHAACTHGVFPQGAWDRLLESPAVERIFATDSHPRAVSLAPRGLEIASTVEIFAEALREERGLDLI